MQWSVQPAGSVWAELNRWHESHAVYDEDRWIVPSSMFPSRSVLFAPLFCFFLCDAICHPVGARKDTRGEDDRRLCNPVQRNEGRCIRVAWYLSFDKQPWPWRALVNFVPMYMFVCSWYLVRDHEMKAIHCSFWVYTSWIPSEPYSLSFSIHHTLWISFVLCLHASISWLLLHIFLLSLSHHQGSRISLMTTGTRCEPGISSRR